MEQLLREDLIKSLPVLSGRMIAAVLKAEDSKRINRRKPMAMPAEAVADTDVRRKRANHGERREVSG